MRLQFQRFLVRFFATLLMLGYWSAYGQTRNLQVSPASPQAEPLTNAIQASVAVDVPLRVPPPSIADLTVLLQSYRPDVQRVARLRKELEEPLPSGLEGARMAIALHKKANAAEELQEVELRVKLLEEALTHAKPTSDPSDGSLGSWRRMRLELIGALRPARGITASLDSSLAALTELESQPGMNLGWFVGVLHHVTKNYVNLGDMDNAQRYLAKLDQTIAQLALRRQGNAIRMPNWLRQAESLRGDVFAAQGKLPEAENAYKSALRQAEDAIALLPVREEKGMFARSDQRSEAGVDDDQIRLAHVYVTQSRIDEAELLLRDVLKRVLARDGRNSILAGKALINLARVMLNRGRSAEAVVLAQWSLQSSAEAGLGEFSPPRVNGQIILANALLVQGHPAQAVAIIDRLRAKLSDDSLMEESFAKGTLQSIRAFIQVGRLNDALADGDNLLQTKIKHLGPQHYETAEARAFRAMALHRFGREDEARKEFDQATQVLLDPNKVTGRQQSNLSRTQRLRTILGEYLTLLVGRKGSARDADMAKAFMLADVARWQSVQKAVAGSAVRAATGNPELAERIKKVQDADDEIQAVYKNLISLRSAPPDKQLPSVIKAMELRIATLQKEQLSDLATIRRQFPQYDALVNPKPADLQATRKALRGNEALLSVYVNPQGTYVWALGPDGVLRFHFSDKPPQWMAERVKSLRSSVDLTSGLPVDRLRFDVKGGMELYAELLAPVAAAWEKADTLIVVANDVLGQIPFSMLPTGPVEAPSASGGVPLAQYRDVPWLVRKVAVAYLPSVSSLITLRALPSARRDREPFLGFGDPDFGRFAGKGVTRSSSTKMRNLAISRPDAWSEEKLEADITPVASAVVARPTESVAPPPAPQAATEDPALPPLPDTREEITAIAHALAANVERDAFFGTQANPRKVMQVDLHRRRIVAFATHGLMAGDLPGLDQPALALSPSEGRSIMDGLLRLEDILKLSLDADLVVLSACNTAASDGAGSEAVSGLGRGFFYAGARSILATHWPVETVSARELVTKLFEGYSRDPNMTRAQALRSTMLALLDRGGAVDARGTMSLSYAHPAFWAPYALYGDPGR